MAITIAIVNEKGGVGKTTTTVSLGAAYARSGMRTLLIDMDPQASLTRGLIGSVWTDRLPASATVAALFGDEVVPAERIIQATKFPNLSLLPGSRHMKAMNRLEPSEYGTGQFALRDLVAEVGFDRVLIDNPPNLEFCAWASMVASAFVLTPLQAEDYGAQGVQFVREVVVNLQGTVNPRLRLLGLVRTMYQKRAAVHITFSERLAQEFPGLLLDGFMPHATHFREAVMAQTPISFYKPRSAAAKSVAAIVEELEARIARLQAVKAPATQKEAV